MNNVCILARAPGGQMRGAATQAMWCHRRGAATKQMPARRRAPPGCGPQARWLCCSLLACDSCANGNKPGSSHNPGILESVLNRRISNRRISNFEVPVPRRSYVCGSIFVIRHSAVCFQLPLPANRHSLFNPAPPEAMLTCNQHARRSRLASGPGGQQQNVNVIY